MEGARHRQFMIHDCLGRGGFGEVYRATMLSPGGLKTRVALKLLRVDVDPDGDAMSRLRDEGRLLAALRHPAILRAYDLALLDGRIGLVTEYVEGQDLHACIGPTPDALTPRAAVEVVGSVAEALHAAWTTRLEDRTQPLQLIHRDIKPSNIRLGLHGEVKLLDFGIARSDEVDREARTGTGSTVGSLSYMAPERFSRESPGPEADVYALGCTLYEALAGHRLHVDPVPVEMFRLAATPEAHDRHIDASLDELPASLGAVRPLLRSMLTHDKAARPDAEAVARSCEDLQESMPGDTLKRWSRNRVWPDADRVSGTFDGRTITEGTLSGVNDGLEPLPEIDSQTADTFSFDVPGPAPAPDETEELAETEEVGRAAVLPPPPNRTLLWGGLGVLLLLGVGGVALVTYGPRDTPVPPGPSTVTQPVPTVPDIPPVQPEPQPQTEPVVPEPVVPEPVVPDPVVPEPVVPEPVEPAAPDPVAPDPVAPEPIAPVPTPDPVTPAPDPEPAVERFGNVVVNGQTAALRVELKSVEGTFAPGRVPVGRYTMMVNGEAAGSVRVYEAQDTLIDCNAVRWQCSPR
ncbi:MAG: serine/threonine-protein kinase [Myxococcota bacterium]